MKIDRRRRLAALSLAGSLALMGVGVSVVSAAEPGGTGIEATAPETGTSGVEADGPGGHADAPGVDVNHDFQGEE